MNTSANLGDIRLFHLESTISNSIRPHLHKLKDIRSGLGVQEHHNYSLKWGRPPSIDEIFSESVMFLEMYLNLCKSPYICQRCIYLFYWSWVCNSPFKNGFSCELNLGFDFKIPCSSYLEWSLRWGCSHDRWRHQSLSWSTIRPSVASKHHCHFCGPDQTQWDGGGTGSWGSCQSPRFQWGQRSSCFAGLVTVPPFGSSGSTATTWIPHWRAPLDTLTAHTSPAGVQSYLWWSFPTCCTKGVSHWDISHASWPSDLRWTDLPVYAEIGGCHQTGWSRRNVWPQPGVPSYNWSEIGPCSLLK